MDPSTAPSLAPSATSTATTLAPSTAPGTTPPASSVTSLDPSQFAAFVVGIALVVLLLAYLAVKTR